MILKKINKRRKDYYIKVKKLTDRIKRLIDEKAHYIEYI